jgi:hypothetical protein
MEEIPEPGVWLRRQVVTRSRLNQELVEIFQKSLRSSTNLHDPNFFGVPHSALYGVLVQSFENRFNCWSQVDAMQNVVDGRLES